MVFEGFGLLVLFGFWILNFVNRMKGERLVFVGYWSVLLGYWRSQIIN